MRFFRQFFCFLLQNEKKHAIIDFVKFDLVRRRTAMLNIPAFDEKNVYENRENKKNRINEAAEVDKRTIGYKRRQLSIEKGTHAMLTLLEAAKKAAIPAKYVLFDSWFSSPSTLHSVKKTGYDVIGMVKKSPKMFFRYNGEDMPLVSIYNKNKKRRGKSKYLLSIMIFMKN